MMLLWIPNMVLGNPVNITLKEFMNFKGFAWCYNSRMVTIDS